MSEKTDRLGRRALKLFANGQSGREVGRALGISAARAHELSSTARHQAAAYRSHLKATERLLLRTCLMFDMPGMTKSRDVEWSARKARGWVARTRARLEAWGWIRYQVNGYVMLTEEGRAVALLLEEKAA